MNQPIKSLIAKLTLLFFLCLLSISYSQSPCETRDRNALIAFYNSLDGPNWINNTNWSSAAPLNTWHGVSTNANGCVIGIDFVTTNIPGGNNLNGTLPPELGDLTDLQTLNLINHNISGPIPSTIGNLTNLERLNLTNNFLNGPIPAEIGSLANLRILELVNNTLNGSIPDEVGNLTNLEMIMLNRNTITGAIPTTIGNLTNLTVMWLSDNQLNGPIPNSLSNLVNLQNLSLGNNQLDGNIPDIWTSMQNLVFIGLNDNLLSGQIPPSISQLGNLFQLNLSFNRLSGSIPPGFQNLSSLTALYLVDNELEGTIPDLSGLPIVDMRFQNNRFQFGDFENQFGYYSNPANLATFLDNPQANLGIEETRNIIEGNGTSLVTVASGNFNQYQWFKDGVPLTDAGNIAGSNTDTLIINNATVADNGVYNCEVESTLVTDLILRRNNVTLNVLPNNCTQRDRDALIALYNATNGSNWTNNTNWNTAAPLNTWYGVITNSNGCVTRLDMNLTNNQNGNNNLTGIIPDEIGNLLNLEFLDLSYQDLSGPIPTSIGNLQDLLGLQLGNNRLTGELPATLGNLLNLDNLDVRNNELNGPLPAELGNLTLLRFFTGDQNNFTGSIPDSFGNLTNLEAIWLYENQLSGAIPITLGNLLNLRQFLLDDNLLSGPMPDIWGGLQNLEAIWLGNNRLEGPLPNSISQLPNLEQLWLENNLLSGSIPASIENLVSLEILVLGDNNFTGAIPPQLGNIQTLTDLAIYRTGISGTIPLELGNLPNLETLWLPYNDLSGEIPITFENLLNLETLLLDDNQLTGSLPSRLNLLNGFTHLSISNNMLEGTLPDFTGTSLEYLQIENNRFQFGDFENQFDFYSNNLLDFIDNPQAKVDEIEVLNQNFGETILLSTTASGSQNHYQWYKDGVLLPNSPDSPNLVLTDLTLEDVGVYHVVITSDIVTDLVLTRNDIALNVGCLTTPIVDELDNVVTCGSFILPNLSPNNRYYTGPVGTGVELSAGITITQSQTIYILAGSPACGTESSFDIIVHDSQFLEEVEDVEVCSSYTLPPILIGNYYSASNGEGNILLSGDVLTESQTIYVYVESGTCYGQKMFSVMIDSNLCPIGEEDQKILFPKFFTPNSDGYNDVWRKIESETTLTGYVRIYDRYGKLISEMDADNGGWDGKYNGIDMPSADYWFEYVGNETGEAMTGHFTLKR